MINKTDYEPVILQVKRVYGGNGVLPLANRDASPLFEMKSLNSNIVEVMSNGLLVPRAYGEATLRASLRSNWKITKDIKVVVTEKVPAQLGLSLGDADYYLTIPENFESNVVCTHIAPIRTEMRSDYKGNDLSMRLGFASGTKTNGQMMIICDQKSYGERFDKNFKVKTGKYLYKRGNLGEMYTLLLGTNKMSSEKKDMLRSWFQFTNTKAIDYHVTKISDQASEMTVSEWLDFGIEVVDHIKSGEDIVIGLLKMATGAVRRVEQLQTKNPEYRQQVVTDGFGLSGNLNAPTPSVMMGFPGAGFNMPQDEINFMFELNKRDGAKVDAIFVIPVYFLSKKVQEIELKVSGHFELDKIENQYVIHKDEVLAKVTPIQK